jgi:hypothetical protein
MDSLFINGNWREGAGAPIRSFDPSTGAQVFEAAAATRADVSDAVNAARAALAGWAQTPLSERIAIMRRYKDIIERDAESLARLISKETGKPFWETKTESATVAGKVDISIRAHEERTGTRETASGATRGMLRHKPHGVMAVLGFQKASSISFTARARRARRSLTRKASAAFSSPAATRPDFSSTGNLPIALTSSPPSNLAATIRSSGGTRVMSRPRRGPSSSRRS